MPAKTGRNRQQTCAVSQSCCVITALVYLQLSDIKPQWMVLSCMHCMHTHWSTVTHKNTFHSHTVQTCIHCQSIALRLGQRSKSHQIILPCFFTSICLSSPFFFFFNGVIYTASHSHSPLTSLSSSSFLLSLSLLHFSLLFSLSVVSRTNKGVWNVSVLTCTVWFGSGIFMQNSSSIYCRACSHTAQAYAIPNSFLHTL